MIKKNVDEYIVTYWFDRHYRIQDSYSSDKISLEALASKAKKEGLKNRAKYIQIWVANPYLGSSWYWATYERKGQRWYIVPTNQLKW